MSGKVKVPKGTRVLSSDMLGKVYACTRARLAFVRTFYTFGPVYVSKKTILGLSDDRIAMLAECIGGESWILSDKGLDLFYKAAKKAKVNCPYGVDQQRKHLALLAHYYVLYPAKFPK